MNRCDITVESATVAHPTNPRGCIYYYLIPLPAAIAHAWSFLCVEAEDNIPLKSEFLYDVTREEDAAKALFRLAINGCVLPGSLQEVFAEQEV